VENAIKHNIVSVSAPLKIKIHIDGNFISVENTYQPKISKEAGAGLGLINIRKRYNLLTKREIAYFIKDKEFVVKLPLL
ncbi:MAG: histidine kinase, partial [Chitinophagaceae bacterium]|nr:histidine kinase [Chitinophagaceae bacterium]